MSVSLKYIEGSTIELGIAVSYSYNNFFFEKLNNAPKPRLSDQLPCLLVQENYKKKKVPPEINTHTVKDISVVTL